MTKQAKILTDAENAALLETLERMHARGMIREYGEEAFRNHAQILAALSQLDALRWYADLNNWSHQEWEYTDEFGDNVTANAIPADHDQGHRARIALGENK